MPNNKIISVDNMQDLTDGISIKADEQFLLSSVEKTLTASGWSKNGNYYTQSLTVTGMTPLTNGFVGISTSASDAQRAASLGANVHLTSQGNGSITFAAGKEPSSDIPIVITFQGG